jgi:endonuclease-3 related protein
MGFEELYEKLKTSHGPQGKWWPGSQEEIIVSVILTQNTNWKNVEKALKNVKSICKENILICLSKLSTEELAMLIRPAGFHNVKAKRIKSLIEWIKKYDFSLDGIVKKDLYELRNELISINGIGKESADSILLYAFEKPIFVVDAYTKMLVKRVLSIEFKEYDEYRTFFEEKYEKSVELYQEFHGLIVEHCKIYCRNIPRCMACPLNYCCLYNSK